PECNGSRAIIRISEIKPGGTMDGLLAAVAAQKAWYRSHGVTDNEIFAARIQERGEPGFSDKQVMTYHVNPPSPGPTRDD
ncbi:hypothetical protein ABTM36_20465, partial [Acinetobacter baumannii]